MSEDTEKTKKLVAFKKKIQTRIDEVDAELEELQAALEAVDSILLEKGFKHAEIATKPSEIVASLQEEKQEGIGVGESHLERESEPESVNMLKSVAGEVLADLYIDDGSMHVVPAEGKDFDINTPPFNQFLVQRVLLKMQERDNELVRSGQLAPEKILCFDIIREGDIVREIVIRNFGLDRLRELKSSIRWTFEKMREKARG